MVLRVFACSNLSFSFTFCLSKDIFLVSDILKKLFLKHLFAKFDLDFRKLSTFVDELVLKHIDLFLALIARTDTLICRVELMLNF